jgi:biopolymer transport protein ExbD
MLSNSLANPTPMEVPEAIYGRGVNLEGQQLLLVDQDGAYYLGADPRPENRAESIDALVAEVQTNASAVEGNMDVIISAHKKTKYLEVRDLVERLESVPGVGRLMLGVEEPMR